MPYTLAQARSTLGVRLGSALRAAGVTTDPGVPADAYADAVAYGLVALGVAPADPTLPTDAEVGQVPAASWFKFADVAELRLLEAAVAALAALPTVVDVTDVRKERDARALLAYLTERRKLVSAQWGFGLPALGAGSINPTRSGFSPTAYWNTY